MKYISLPTVYKNLSFIKSLHTELKKETVCLWVSRNESPNFKSMFSLNLALNFNSFSYNVNAVSQHTMLHINNVFARNWYTTANYMDTHLLRSLGMLQNHVGSDYFRIWRKRIKWNVKWNYHLKSRTKPTSVFQC
jgi:hypothetical protein